MGDKGIVEPITINNESTAGLVLIIFLIDFFFFYRIRKQWKMAITVTQCPNRHSEMSWTINIHEFTKIQNVYSSVAS